MSSAAKGLPAQMTTAEFLRWEGDGTDAKYELVDGELVAMSPATATHGRIQANLAFLLSRHLEHTRCSVIIEAAIVPRVAAETNTRVPDLAVTCSPDIPGEVGLTDPVVVIEILSAGNKSKTWSNVWPCVDPVGTRNPDPFVMVDRGAASATRRRRIVVRESRSYSAGRQHHTRQPRHDVPSERRLREDVSRRARRAALLT